MNMLALRTGDDIIVIDAGLMFPEQELLGVDIVIPDITYLKQNKRMVRAIVLTHAHEDHIGAIPYILGDLNVPIYGTEFTLAIVRKKLEEHALLDKAKLHEVKAGQTTAIGPFPDRIPARDAQHHRLRRSRDSNACRSRHPHRRLQNRSHAGRRQALRPACLRPLRPGRRARAFQRQHQRRAPGLHAIGTRGRSSPGRIIPRRPAKVVVSCFSSSVHRVQQVIDIARMVGRKVGFVGRSMVDNIEIAHGLGKLRIPDGSVVRPQDIRSFDPQKLVVLASGTQAEPMSALSRIAVDNHRLMSIAENDTVILSSRIIPGNEKAIFRMIDHFFRRRVLVYYEGGRSAPIHVSGHASQEEMKILLQLVRPKYFIPMHGEYRHLFRHSALAEQFGAVGSQIFLLESGQP